MILEKVSNKVLEPRMGTEQFDGKRTGRPKGSKAPKMKSVVPAQIMWVFKNLDAEEGKETTPPSPAWQTMLTWARKSPRNRDYVVKHVMAAMMRESKVEEKVEESEHDKAIMTLVEDVLASWEREAARQKAV